MFSKLLNKGLPKCRHCIYYIPGGYSKNYDLGKCTRFTLKPIYAEMARMDDLKCSIYGLYFKQK